MIAGPALTAWLADRDGQSRSLAAVNAFSERWRLQPLMTRLQRALADRPEPTAEGVLDAARAFLDSTDEIGLLMEQLIAASRKDPYFRPPFHSLASEVHAGLVLFNDAELSIALGVSGVERVAAKKADERASGSIAFAGVTQLFRYLKAGGATLSFWEAPPITDSFLASRAGKCRLVDRRRIEDGEEILIDGRYQSFVVEHASSDLLFLQATVHVGAAPLVVEYDGSTHNFVGASSTDEASSRVQMMVSLLRTMERADALPLIEESLASPHFYTRWHVMRELLALDAEAALPALRRMAAADPHPEVRGAARQTLDMFFPDEREEEGAAEQGGVQCRA
ncbi:MAG: hypothetical protein QOJ53_341 [Sphingomonadales bacterium]|jgi:hypothetical protein|nr:hypothetical protein [Sphingomonadales bacterium]